MNQEAVWEAMSYAWSEIGLDGDEYDDHARQIAAGPDELRAFDFEALGIVCGAFALETVRAFLTMGMSMPDWGWEREYVLDKVDRWRRRPLLWSLLNPFWLAGFPLSCLMALPVWHRLRKAIVAHRDR